MIFEYCYFFIVVPYIQERDYILIKTLQLRFQVFLDTLFFGFNRKK